MLTFLVFFPVVLLFWALLGLVCHFMRGFIAIFPERITGRPFIDMHLPGGYSLTDLIFQVEFDEDGYYRLDSWHNARHSVAMCVVMGIVVTIFIPESVIATAQIFIDQFQWRLGQAW